MSGMYVRRDRRPGPGRLAFLFNLLLQLTGWVLAGWVLPGTVQAQQYAAPYKAQDLNSSVAATTYQTLDAAIAYAQAYLTARYGATTSDHCYLVAVKKDPGAASGLNAQVGYTSPSSDQGAQEVCYVDHDAFLIYATNEGYDIGKNAGDCDCHGGNGGPGSGSSPKGSSGDAAQDSKGASPGLTVVGDPVNTTSGNKYQQDTDFRGSPWLTFRRFYNSGAGIGNAIAQAALGPQWRHSFDRSLVFQLAAPGSSGTSTVRLYRPDGRNEQFKLGSGAWTPDADVADTLTQQNDASGQPVGYTVFMAAPRQWEQYSPAGLLQSITDQAGTVTTLAYSTASTSAAVAPAPNLLLTVSDPMGRTLQFTYDGSARVHTVTAPDGGVLTYGYDPSTGNLSSVQYPDGKTLQYIYNEASLTASTNLPTALTGVVDEAGTRFASTGYNSAGKVVSATFAGGADAIAVVYGYVGQAQVTTPLGLQPVINATNDGFGTFKVTSNNKACGNECNQPWSSVSYDANGYPKKAYDFNQNITGTTYDAHGLLDQQVEASGTASQRTTTTTWNTALRVPLTQTVQDNNGVTVALSAWAYNARGQVTAQCQIDPTVSGAASYACGSAANAPAGVRQWTMTYCNAVDGTQCPLIGLLLTTTGPRTDLAQTTRYAYYLADSATARHGDLKSVTDALGHVTTIASYDGAGRITRTIDPNRSVTDYAYGPRGWLTSRIVRFNANGSADPYDDATTTLTYTAYGAVQTVTDPDGVKITYGYDPAHRLTTITDALGNAIQYTLDASGHRTAEKTFAAGSSTPSRTLTRSFNTLGQLTKLIDGLNQTVLDASAYGSYDGNGNLLQSTDANGIVHQQGYDALDRLVQRIDNFNGADPATKNTTTTQHWDALDRLTQVTDPGSLVTTYGYDGLGNPVSLSSPDTGSSHASFDAAGNLLSRTDANGITVTHSYDALDRRLTDSYADSTLNASYHYDDPDSVVDCSAVSSPSNATGHLTRIVESAVTTTWCYDRNDHLGQQTQLTAGHTDVTEFFLSGAGRLQGRIAPDNVGAFYQYDRAGRATTVTISPRPGIDNGSTPIQNATYLPFGPMTSYQLNYQTVTRSYDANYALTDITSAALNLHVARDPLGNIVAEGNSPGANPAVESYGYDPLNQLRTITQGSTAIESLTYNPTGDRLSKAGSGLATGAYGYDTGTHHLSSIGNTARSYDANGNTTGSSGAGQTWGYGYNGRNRLAVVQAGGSTVGSYLYNALGQRIQKTVTAPTAATQRFFYDEQSHLIGEYTVGGGNRDTIWLDDMPVATVDTNGTTSATNFVVDDQLGTPRAVVNSAGSTIWSWPYVGNAFGELAPSSATGYVLNLRFPGQYFDAESGLIHNGYRDYCIECGRYIQSDPLGLFSGQSNTYGYVDNNPLLATDQYGLAKSLQDSPWLTLYKSMMLGIAAHRAIQADVKLSLPNMDVQSEVATWNILNKNFGRVDLMIRKNSTYPWSVFEIKPLSQWDCYSKNTQNHNQLFDYVTSLNKDGISAKIGQWSDFFPGNNRTINIPTGLKLGGIAVDGSYLYGSPDDDGMIYYVSGDGAYLRK